MPYSIQSTRVEGVDEVSLCTEMDNQRSKHKLILTILQKNQASIADHEKVKGQVPVKPTGLVRARIRGGIKPRRQSIITMQMGGYVQYMHLNTYARRYGELATERNFGVAEYYGSNVY